MFNKENQVLIVLVVDTSGSMRDVLDDITSALEGMVANLKLEKAEYLPMIDYAIILTSTSLSNGVKELESPQLIKNLGSIKFKAGGSDALNYGIEKGINLINSYSAKNYTYLSPCPILIAVTDASGSEVIDEDLCIKLVNQVNSGAYTFWTHVFSADSANFEHFKNLVADDIVINYDSNRTLNNLLHKPLFSKLDELLRDKSDEEFFVRKALEMNRTHFEIKMGKAFEENKKHIDSALDRNKKDISSMVQQKLTDKKDGVSSMFKIVLNGCIFKMLITIFISLFSIGFYFRVEIGKLFEFNFFYQEVNVSIYKNDVQNINQEFNIELNQLKKILSPEVTIEVDLEYHYHNEKVKKDCDDCYNSLVLRYTLEDTVPKYSLGKYHVISNRATKLSAEYIEKKIEQLLDTFDLRGAFKVKIRGETDATPIRTEGIPYESEFGAIAGEMYKNVENDSVQSIGGIYLAWKDRIQTNEELAFLRAYAFKKYLMQWAKPFIIKPPTFQYYTKTNNENKGENYRKVIIEVYFYSVIKKINSYKISDSK